MRLLIFLLLLLLVSKVKAQEPLQRITFDTVYLKKGFVITVYSRSYISDRDTVLLIPKSVPYRLQKKKQNIFERLDSTAKYNRFTRELRNMILVKQKSQISVEAETSGKSETNYIDYKGKIIRNITFKQLDVFGPTVDDTSRTAVNWIQKTGNKLHIKSKPYLLRNNLIIKPGDEVDPLKLADNERILREASYIHDARIYVRETESSDSVDIYIVLKDVWPKAFDLKLNNLYGGSFSMWDRNIFGFGHENQNSLFWDSKEKESVGYEGVYSIPNIGGSFIRGRGQYLDKFGNQTYGISFDRNFYTPNTKYAGGLSYYKTNKPDYFTYPDTTLLLPVEYTKSDFWLGRSFSLNRLNFKFQSRNNLSFILRVTKTDVLKRPQLDENLFYGYQNRTLYLSSIAFTKQNYFKSNLIYNYGRTEDIPYGMLLQFTSGYETNEFKSRVYLASKVAFARYNPNLGYLYMSVGHDGFINAEKKTEQGAVNAKLNYFSPLVKYDKFKLRYFVNIDYTKGINRYKDEYLTLNNDYGLNGFVNDSLRGNERLNFQFETVCFSPWYFHEFRFVFFASSEFSLFGKNIDLWKNPVYSGISFGVRIRNERLVFNTIELRFHLYPNIKQYSNTQLMNLSGENVLSPEDFRTLAPEVSRFR